ncbi:MAG: hypothetical protein B6D61_06900 [Bacteroidetes bacterium 4484_249]|nr:MAG: hypothetical protein B6D61_06900 [Bacteroidetes bacterium 4484_249]
MKHNYSPMKTRYLLSLVVLFSAITGVKSQDQNYSQFFNNNIYYNPAYAGLYNGVRTSVNYRNQWTNLPYDFKSYNVAVDMSARSLPGAGGLGLIIHHNNEGEGMINNLYAGLVLATRIHPSEDYAIQFGITTAICQKKIDWDGLVFPDQLDGKYGNIFSTNFTEPYRSDVIYPDFNFGTVLNYNSEGMNARIGGSVHHIFQPKIGFVNAESQLYMKFVAHADAVIYINKGSTDKWKKGGRSDIARINPGILYENQNGANAFSLGLNAYKSYIYLGLWYRNEDINTTNLNSMVFLAGVNLPINEDSRIKIMYSYDYIMNKLIATGGTHEISVIFEFSNENVFGAISGKGKKKNWGTIPCATF